jgi:hypothetical protein
MFQFQIFGVEIGTPTLTNSPAGLFSQVVDQPGDLV